MAIDALRRAHHPTLTPDVSHPPSAPTARRLGDSHVHRTAGSVALAAQQRKPGQAEIQRRLNEQLSKMGGPYRVNGREVFVPAGFRMNGGMRQLSAGQYVNRLKQALSAGNFAKLAPTIGYVVSGKGTPEQIQRTTQALIDSPAFRAYAGMPAEKAVRTLMWDYGVGADCSGYVHNAFIAARGGSSSARRMLGDPLASGLQAPSSAYFRKVAPAASRAGDVMVLTNGDDGTGHKVIVFANHVVPAGSDLRSRVARELGSQDGAAIHLLEVDSSWGAGGDPERGGVKREVFALDSSSGKWATLVKDSRGQWQVFASKKSGPYDHDLGGVYRPKDEP